jgi:NAD(P)H-hydrate epimerase
MSRLTGKSSEEILAAPKEIAKAAAKSWKQTVVLKCGFTIATDGHATIIADDAPPSLASAGTGDVFAGLIGGFLAQGVALLDAAGLAIYLGSRAARNIEGRYGVLGLVASDLPAAVAAEIAALERKRGSTGG